MREKLLERYNTVVELHRLATIRPILLEQDLKYIKEGIQSCLDNKPDWSERPSFKKFTDILSLGLKPMYRAFCKKEDALQESVIEQINPKI